MLKISYLRDALVFDENFQKEKIDCTIYDKVGQIEGLKAIVASLFKLIAEDDDLQSFYKQKNNVTTQNKYTYFIANQIGATFDLIPPEIHIVHKGASSQPIQQEHFVKWIELFKQVLVER